MNKNYSLKSLINEIEKLSKDPTNNKKKLEELRKKLIKYSNTLNRCSTDKLKDKLSSDHLSYKEFTEYNTLLSNKKYANKKKTEIDLIKEENYTMLGLNRKIKKLKKYIAVTSVALIGSLYAISVNNKKNDNFKKDITTIETTTEELTTEKTTTEELTTTEDITTTEELTTTEEITEEITTEIISSEEELDIEKKDNYYQISVDDIIGLDIDKEKVQKIIDVGGKVGNAIDIMEEAILDKDKRKEVLSSAKDNVIKLIDFIFYGAEIKGVTFDELEDDVKEKVYEKLQKLDTLIMKYEPKYKEELSEKYNAVKDFATTKKDQVVELIKDKIGEEKYNELIDKKDKAVEKTKDTGKKLVNKLDEWYHIWKEE